MHSFMRYVIISGVILWSAHGSFFAEEQVAGDTQTSGETTVPESEATTEATSETEETTVDAETSTDSTVTSEAETQTIQETTSEPATEKTSETEKATADTEATTDETATSGAETQMTEDKASETAAGEASGTETEKTTDGTEATTETKTEESTSSVETGAEEKKEETGTAESKTAEETTEQETGSGKKWYDAIGLQPLIDYYEKLLRAIEVFKQRINPAMHKSALEYSLDGTQAYKQDDTTLDFAALQNFVSFSYYQKISGSMSGLNLVNHERFVNEVIPKVGAAKFPTGFASVDKYQAQCLLVYEGYHQYSSFVQGAIIDKIDGMMNGIIESIKTETYKQVIKDHMVAYQAAKKVQKVSVILDASMKTKKSIKEWLAAMTKIYDEKKGAPFIASALEANCSMPRGNLMLRLKRARHQLYYYLLNNVPELSDDQKKNLTLMYLCENRVDVIHSIE